MNNQERKPLKFKFVDIEVEVVEGKEARMIELLIQSHKEIGLLLQRGDVEGALKSVTVNVPIILAHCTVAPSIDTMLDTLARLATPPAEATTEATTH